MRVRAHAGTVPQTLCLTAAHARALTANFKKVLLAVDINTAKQGAEKYSMRELVYNTWEAWANVSVFLHSTKADGTRFTYENRAEDAKAFGVAAREFGYWFVLAYGTGCVLQVLCACMRACASARTLLCTRLTGGRARREITPYIHLLVEHGEWYWAKYGPYSYWNCQGLERSNSVFKRRLTVRAQFAAAKMGGARRPLTRVRCCRRGAHRWAGGAPGWDGMGRLKRRWKLSTGSLGARRCGHVGSRGIRSG